VKQFFVTHFTDHCCGGSIPRRLKIWGLIAAFWVADRAPWFLRKRVINWLFGREILSDFCQTDLLQRGEPICIKW
jgi:hypothetical protein